MDPVQRLRVDYHSGHLRITNESDLEGIIIPGLTRSMARMVPVREDESGFRAFCIHSHIGWIKVRFSTYSRSSSPTSETNYGYRMPRHDHLRLPSDVTSYWRVCAPCWALYISACGRHVLRAVVSIGP